MRSACCHQKICGSEIAKGDIDAWLGYIDHLYELRWEGEMKSTAKWLAGLYVGVAVITTIQWNLLR
jgi:hypothetical protein